MSNLIGTLGIVNGFSGADGLQTTDPTAGMIQLVTYTSGAGNEGTFRLPTGSAAYATTGGGLLIKSILLRHGLTGAQAGGLAILFSHDTNVDAGIDGADNAASGTATNKQYYGGSASCVLGGGWLMTGSQQYQYIPVHWLVPTSKYISMEGGCDVACHIFGIPQ